jgi:hypothetical protein
MNAPRLFLILPYFHSTIVRRHPRSLPPLTVDHGYEVCHGYRSPIDPCKETGSIPLVIPV